MQVFLHRFKVLVALIMVFVLTGIGPVLGGTLDDQLKKNKSEQDKIKKQISKYKDQEEDLIQDLADTTQKIAVSKDKLAKLDQQLTAADAEVNKAEKELKDAELLLQQRTEALQKRMRGMYEQGQIGYLEVLFQSANLGDFINNVEYVSKILAHDTKLVRDISAEKEELKKQHAELVKKRDSVARVKAEQEKQKAELQGQEAAYQGKLKQSQAALDDLFQEMQEKKEAENQIRDLISKAKPRNPGQVSNLVWPAPAVHTISSKFGYRYHPVLGYTKLHTGMDIPVSMGSQVVAAASGEVIYAGYMTGYGYTILIAHSGSMQTLYAHLSSYAVHTGDEVQAGQTIAYSGGAKGHPGAGYSTGPHLHFEVRINGVPEDPLNYL
ncbi:MAG TPA: peptidoglycan DD-metalloendopeptidase family protein [Verrucomicrobiae bacterium]|nr:peptidoglycan DD-metalloendopeptidase family protein [Verrucomicrobiae bacterium]